MSARTPRDGHPRQETARDGGGGRLEAGYRRLLRLYPRRHRTQHGEEMLAVLLDAAPAQSKKVPRADTGDLLRGAASAHTVAVGRRAARHPGTTAAMVTILLGLLPAVLPGAPPPPAAASTLPDALADYSPLTATVGQSPPGPAVAIYRQGSGAELFDAPQTVVAGASGAYRRLDLAERRGGMSLQGPGDQARSDARQAEPSPSALSPGGAVAAVGAYLPGGTDAEGSAPGLGLDVALQDLSTGAVVRHPLDDGREARPLAWSPDGKLLAVLVHREPQSLRLVPAEQDLGLDRSGWVAVVDTVTGEVRRIEPETSWRPEAATFSPDGQRLAVQDEAGALGVVDLTDGSMTDLGSPDLFLSSDDGWSPDGALLLGMQRSSSGLDDDPGCITFVSLTSEPAPGCLPVDRYGLSSLLGWTGARSVAIAVARGAADGEVDTVDVLGVDVSDGWARSITSIPTRGGDAPAFMVDVARDALQAGRVSAAPGTDRGSWPWGLRVVVIALAAALAALAARISVAAASSRRSAPPGRGTPV